MVSSSDEGEIIENDAVDLKATSLPKKFEGNGVDRQDRTRDRYSASKSPEYDSNSAHAARQGNYNNHTSRRSRSPRGFKRSRDERDHAGGGGGGGRQDTRRFRVHYEDGPRDDFRRTRVSYEDLDRPASRGSNHSYDGRDRSRERDRFRERERDRDRERDRERDRYPDKRARNRTRSPYRPPRGDRGRDDRHPRGGGRDRLADSFRGLKYDDHRDRDTRNGNSTSNGVAVGKDPRASKPDAKPVKDFADKKNSAAGPSQNQPVLRVSEPEPDFEEPMVVDEEAEIERRRRRRDELLAKSSSATPLLVHALHASDKSAVPSPARQGTPAASDVETPVSDVGSPAQDGSSPGAIDILSEKDLMNTHAIGKVMEEDGPSAADYDPTVDMKEDGIRDEMRHGNVDMHGKALDNPPEAQPQEQPQEAPAKKPSGDEEDDDFDMFAEDFDDEKYAAPKVALVAAVDESKASPAIAQPNGAILEGDDKDGYYKIRIGEILNGRYQVQSTLGKGMFSGVARAVDITNKKLVAIKIMRSNDALRKGGFTEIAILQKLNDADPDSRKHIVKFERHFDHKGHLCMAFENLSLNLREVLRKFGNNVGINLSATRAYAHQIFIGLAHMRKCSIVHADLKPDNILVNESRNVLKICDLGTGIDKSDAATSHSEITPYLVSRFYRAPEIILGMPYEYAIDMWSIGCTLYELYTGKILFAGDSNNQMLKAIMEIRGKITPKLYKRGQLSGMHFDEQGNFVSMERDKALGKTTARVLPVVKPTRDLRTRLFAASAGMNDAETRDLNHFVDLLEHCLTLNPEKRIKPADALKHPFFTSRAAPSKR